MDRKGEETAQKLAYGLPEHLQGGRAMQPSGAGATLHR